MGCERGIRFGTREGGAGIETNRDRNQVTMSSAIKHRLFDSYNTTHKSRPAVTGLVWFYKRLVGERARYVGKRLQSLRVSGGKGGGRAGEPPRRTRGGAREPARCRQRDPPARRPANRAGRMFTSSRGASVCVTVFFPSAHTAAMFYTHERTTRTGDLFPT
ncbi:hypothetical protein EVAR_67731_1 [Eumeta japonica]|uniref:Uncharacterized protein n=1 Tax=Eumeta variegata TaxID=151549 RepID=A0A4C1ZEN7_EUMVA|nr:hypothetical protein EVAR_67731_1 [Eumeta japonica]